MSAFVHVHFGLWRGEERDWAAVPPLAVDRGGSPWFEALTWVCGNLVNLPSEQVWGGVHFVLLRFWAGLLWTVLIPVFSWGRFGWGSLFDRAGEEETLSFLCLVPAFVSFIIESVMAPSFPVDLWGTNFGDGANTCLEWSCIVFSHLDSDGLVALGFNLIAFLVGDLRCSTGLDWSFNWAYVCNLGWSADVLSFRIFFPADLLFLFRVLAVSLVQDLGRSDDETSDWDIKWFKIVLFFSGVFYSLDPLTIVHSGTSSFWWLWSFDFDPGGLAALNSLMIFLVCDLWCNAATVCDFNWGDGVLFFPVTGTSNFWRPLPFPLPFVKRPWSFDFDPGGFAVLVGNLIISSAASVCNFNWGNGVLCFPGTSGLLVGIISFSSSTAVSWFDFNMLCILFTLSKGPCNHGRTASGANLIWASCPSICFSSFF